ncbi:MAG: hypothetical protein AAB731_01035, partial [Patescibacteria group bacterium]
MKRSEAFFSIIQIPLDWAAIILAALTAYSVRFSGFALTIRPATSVVPFEQYINAAMLIGLAWLFIFAAYGLYSIGRPRRLLDEVGRAIGACTFGIMLAVLIIFFNREFFASRFIVLAAWGLAIFFVIFGRVILRAARRLLLRFGVGVHRVVIVGSGKNADILTREFAVHPSLGFRVEKVFSDFFDETRDEILKMRAEDKVDEI